MVTPAKKSFDFEVGVYRPPSEGGSDSLLVRFSRNCPWNRCTFCAMYKQENFSLRSVAELKQDLSAIADIRDQLVAIAGGSGISDITRQGIIELTRQYPELADSYQYAMVAQWLLSGGKTAFIQDANSLLMKTADLVEVLNVLRETFPSLQRVTTYARSHTLARKSLEELISIREAGLDRVHVGLETGDDTLLKRIKKGVTAAEHIKGGRRAVEAGFQLSEYWMPGLGGKAMWRQHAEHTAQVLSEINPHYIRSRPLFPAEGTPLYEEFQRGDFQMQTPHEHLTELKVMMTALNVTGKVCFDHAGNYWRNSNGGLLFSQSYEGYQFPERKDEVLSLIEEGLTVKKAPPFQFRL